MSTQLSASGFRVLIPHFLIDVRTDEVTAGEEEKKEKKKKEEEKKKERRMTASVLKQDPITRKGSKERYLLVQNTIRELSG